MFKKVIIKADERGLLFKRGSYVKHLQPGVYRFSSFTDDTVIVQNVLRPFAPADKELDVFLQDTELLRELAIADVQDNEYVLHYADGKFVSLLTSGKYAFWNVMKRHTFVTINILSPEFTPEVKLTILPKLHGYFQDRKSVV